MVEKIKTWNWQLIAYLAGLIFAVGGFVMVSKANCDRLDKTEQRSIENKENYIRMDQRLMNIEKGVERIEKKLDN